MKILCSWRRRGSTLIDRPARSHHLRATMILARELTTILHRVVRIRALRRQGCEMPFVLGCHLGLCRPIVQSAISAVVADVRVVVDIRYAVVVNVAHYGHVHTRHRAVVVEVSPAPVAAFVAIAAVAISIIHAAVEPDVRTPVAVMPVIAAGVPTPVAWRPQRAHIRRQNPRARYPVIAGRGIRPVAGRPLVVIAWALGLLVVGDHGRRLGRYIVGRVVVLCVIARILVAISGLIGRSLIRVSRRPRGSRIGRRGGRLRTCSLVGRRGWRILSRRCGVARVRQVNGRRILARL